MSDPIAKAERSAAKDARQSPAPDGASTGAQRNRRERPYELWCRSEPNFDGIRFFGWTRWGRYETAELRAHNLSQQRRKMPGFEWEARDK